MSKVCTDLYCTKKNAKRWYLLRKKTTVFVGWFDVVSFYIQSFHYWICCPRGDPCLCVCVSVCLSVCLPVTAFYLKTIGPISMKLGPHDLNKNLRWHISQILEMLPQWRHNDYFDVLRWGTLTPSIVVQFSSNSHMLLFNSWLCMGLQSSVFGSYLLSEMTVEKTVKNQSDVKLKKVFDSYRFWPAEHEYVHGLVIW